jgi:hypothetical protein
VVIIAAGYDTRAYRLGKPGVKFYEIDLPHASKLKQDLVKKHMPADKVSSYLIMFLDLLFSFVAGLRACGYVSDITAPRKGLKAGAGQEARASRQGERSVCPSCCRSGFLWI